jgi:tellurite methyltransferase
MAEADRQRWNQRYRGGAYDFTPAAWLVEHTALVRPRRAGARALDLASGAGRNALYLAELGYSVDAWDIADAALEQLRAELGRRRSAGHRLEVVPRQVDLQAARLPVDAYDLVLDTDFLERGLFASMATALRPGGLLLVRTWLRRAANEERNPAYLLEPDELRMAFRYLETIEYAEDPVQGWASLVGRRSYDEGPCWL